MRRVRVAVVSHQLAGFDGVSQSSTRMMWALEHLGHEVVEVAGRFGDREAPRRERHEVPELWVPDGRTLPAVTADLATAFGGCDAVVLENIATLAACPTGTLAVEAALTGAPRPTVVRHYDASWEHPLRTSHPDIPLRLPFAEHVALTAMLAASLRERRAITASVLHDPLDVRRFADAAGCRDRTRDELGLGSKVFIAHPVSVYPRKRVDRAVRAVVALQSAGIDVCYWLTGGTPELFDDPDLSAAGIGDIEDIRFGRWEHTEQLLAACDVVLMSSEWEGWGIPVLEGAAASRPVVCWPYQVLEEISSLGVVTFGPEELLEVCSDLDAPLVRERVRSNAAAVDVLDVRHLPARVEVLLESARRRLHG